MNEACVLTKSNISVPDCKSGASARIVASSVVSSYSARSFFGRAVSFFGFSRFSKFFYFYFYYTRSGFVSL